METNNSKKSNKKVWGGVITGILIIVIGVAGFLYQNPLEGYNFPEPDKLNDNDFIYGSTAAMSDINYFSRVKNSLTVDKKSFVEADLTAMKLRIYIDGELNKEIEIKSKGKEGSWWETPAGIYKIEAKKKNHLSSIGHVYQPWSMIFQGNFFIHGWPYYEDGTEVSSTYSGGCIRLSTADAEIVYNLTKVGMPVIVYESDVQNDSFKYIGQTPHVTAEKYLLADLKNDTILASQGISDQVPVASITKIMTALVATEYIHIEKNLTVNDYSMATTSKPRLKSGQVITVYDLLFPLLMESSNEAANVIADSMGKNYFVGLMNKKAQAINMKDTRFVDPYGGGDGNVSSAQDLYALAKYVLNNRRFVFNLSAGRVTTSVYGDPLYSDLQNFNTVPGLNSTFLGGKIGKTTAAGETYIGVYEETVQGEKRPIVVILLNSEDVYADSREMIRFLRDNY